MLIRTGRPSFYKCGKSLNNKKAEALPRPFSYVSSVILSFNYHFLISVSWSVLI
jgi:hypothetical protein